MEIPRNKTSLNENEDNKLDKKLILDRDKASEFAYKLLVLASLLPIPVAVLKAIVELINS